MKTAITTLSESRNVEKASMGPGLLMLSNSRPDSRTITDTALQSAVYETVTDNGGTSRKFNVRCSFRLRRGSNVTSAIRSLDSVLSGRRRNSMNSTAMDSAFPSPPRSRTVLFGGQGGIRANDGCVFGESSGCSSLISTQKRPAISIKQISLLICPPASSFHPRVEFQSPAKR